MKLRLIRTIKLDIHVVIKKQDNEAKFKVYSLKSVWRQLKIRAWNEINVRQVLQCIMYCKLFPHNLITNNDIQFHIQRMLRKFKWLLHNQSF